MVEDVVVPLAFLATVAIVVLGLRALRLKATLRGEGAKLDTKALTEVETRLNEIERRLTDVQDVMIALSEKFDRWEEGKSTA
jgi:ABC-type phosphate transport system auxiliary subunit